MASAQPNLQPEQNYALGGVLLNLLDELRRATSLVDVNIAAGVAREELAGLLGPSQEKPDNLVQLKLDAS